MSDDLASTSRSALMKYLEAMHCIRLFEEKVTELRKQQIIVGSVHLCIGQEAIYVGARAAINSDDRVFATYRGHGWALACGVPAAALFAELLGRETGVCKGRGGSAQLSAADWGFYGENSIVGAKIEGKGKVVLTAFGEGAMNQGAVHESMNFAAYQDLPLIFVCENNTYSELTPTAEMVRMNDLYRRADGYGIPGVRVDGNDPAAVRRVMSGFVQAARAGKGPALIEATTQRLVGHYYGDLQSYRPKGELTEAKKTEPIHLARLALQDTGVAAEELDELESKVRNEIEAAAEEALAAPLADVNQVREHLYA
jgi:TPP-dependent pyruvate/acetoin dehydrogenase alpha subunit